MTATTTDDRPRADSLGAQVYAQNQGLVAGTSRAALAETRRILAGMPWPLDRERIGGLVAGWHVAIDQSLDGWRAHMAQETGKAPGCREGCSSCCYQETLVSTVELAGIAVRVPESEREALAHRAARTAERTAKGGSEARYKAAIPCPFLEGTRCGVHPIRPQACRTHYSMSRSACLREWSARRLSPEARARRAGVPMPSGPKALGFGMAAGLDAACHERGLEVELVELSEGLVAALAPGNLERWLAGGRVFAELARLDAAGNLYSRLLENVAREGGMV